jgi:hypothetical protein
MGDDVARINGELVDTSERLTIAVEEYVDACRDAATKRSDYDVAWAKSLLKSQLKTIAERESEAVIACEASMREARIAEAMRDALKGRIRALEAILNSVQTRASFLKEEMRLTGRTY